MLRTWATHVPFGDASQKSCLLSTQTCAPLVLVVEMDEDNGLLLLELNPPNPWDAEPRAPEELAFGEVQVRKHENHSLLKNKNT